jgi:probable phosphoglycerate mutase
MSMQLPIVYIARHGEMALSLTGQHTGVSRLQRARRTCELASFGGVAEIDPDLSNGTKFRDGCPGGEKPGEVEA